MVVQTAKRPPDRTPLTEIRRREALRRDVEGRQGADRLGDLRLRAALGNPEAQRELEPDCGSCGGFDHQDGSVCTACGRRSTGVGPGGTTALSRTEQGLLKRAMDRESEERAAYARDLAQDADRVERGGGDAATVDELRRRAAHEVEMSKSAARMGVLLYDARLVTVTLAPSQIAGGGR
ncbi:MAG: hypothetical protein L6Q35_00600 [Phycisphaerales bacterium]|nr:hypothetical protein [Phycisphaerales bacterium]